jgi:hypothetical protein
MYVKDCPEAREQILQSLREGHAYSQAAAAGGISRVTLIAWRKKDAEFDEACHVAEGAGITKIEDAMLQKALSTDDVNAYNAAKFILERRKPSREDYAPVSHNHPFLAIQHNYMNPLAIHAPSIMGQIEKPPVIEGEVIENG